MVNTLLTLYLMAMFISDILMAIKRRVEEPFLDGVVFRRTSFYVFLIRIPLYILAYWAIGDMI